MTLAVMTTIATATAGGRGRGTALARDGATWGRATATDGGAPSAGRDASTSCGPWMSLVGSTIRRSGGSLRLGEEDAPRFARESSLLTPTRQPSVRTRARGLTRGSSLTAEEQEVFAEKFSSQPLPPEPPSPISPPSPMRRIDSTGKTKLPVLLKEHSGASELVLIRLPPRTREQPPDEWMVSVDRLIEGLRRVILIRESGAEKVQFFQ